MKRVKSEASSGRKKVKDSKSSDAVVLKTSALFRYRLACSVLSQKKVVISEIRDELEEPGVNESEVCFAQILSKVTNGALLSINETGTRVSFTPGVLQGGNIEQDVGPTVRMSWILEGLLPLAPFCKQPLNVTLRGGVTDSDDELGVNMLRSISLKLLERFGVTGASIQCHSRGFLPLGGGSITFTCPIVRKHLQVPRGLDSTKLRVLRVRGIVQASRINPQIANRVATRSRALLENYASDVYVNNECKSNRNKDAGLSPGFGLTMWCELVDTDILQVNQANKVPTSSFVGVSGAFKSDEEDSPEDFAARITDLMLKQVSLRGCVDASHQSLLVLLMATCPEEIAKANLGRKLGKHVIGVLRLIKEFLHVQFKLSTEEDGFIMATCVGNGVGNFSRTVT